jgi:cell division protein FtsQ
MSERGGQGAARNGAAKNMPAKPGARKPAAGRNGARRWRLVRAAPVAIPASVRRFNQRARQRRIASARPWVIAGGVLALLGVASWLVFGSSVLGVSRIEVRGGGFVSDDAIRQASRVRLGTPMVLLDRGQAARGVEKLAAVKSARVEREWPGTLVVTVTLRTPIAAAPLRGGQFVLVDASGVPFRTVGSTQGLPMIETSTTDLTAAPAAAALRTAAAVLASLPPELTAKLVRIEAPSDIGVRLMLTGGRQIVWGDASDNDQKARAALALLAENGKVIDVSAPSLVTVQ